MAAPGKSKSKTGMEEMLGKLFNSPGLAGAAESMDRVQAARVMAPQPVYQPPIAASIESEPFPSAQPAVIAPSPTPSIINESLSDGVLLDRVTVAQSDGQTVTLLHSQTVIQSDSNTVEPLDRQTVKQSTTETVSQDSYQTTETKEVAPQQHYQTVSYQTIPLDVLTLPYNQAVILEYLIGAGGVTNARAISNATHIGIPSVRDAIARLIRRGFMLNPVTIKNAAFQGFSYILNPSMVTHFQAAGGLEQKTYTQASDRLIADRQTVSGFNGVTAEQSHRQTAISSSNKTELTTTPKSQTVAPSDSQTVTPSHSQAIRQSDSTPSDNSQTNFILTGAAGMYWEGEGLQERQAKTWCDQFEIEPAQLKQQLEWARHDLVVNNKAAEVKKDAVSWFFGVLRQTGGCYPKPSNYRSPAEIRAEQMEQAAQELAEARQRQVVAEQELAFQKIMEDPAGEEYQTLLQQVSEFAREMGGKALETAMREIFTGGVYVNP
jgi:hypothetical protein